VGKKVHKDKPVREAIELLTSDARRWRLVKQGHLYHLLCPCGQDFVRVDNSPRNPESHARRILREAARCPDDHDLSGQPTPRGRRP